MSSFVLLLTLLTPNWAVTIRGYKTAGAMNGCVNEGIGGQAVCKESWPRSLRGIVHEDSSPSQGPTVI